MNAELAAAVANPFAQHCVLAKLAVEQTEPVALLLEDRDAPFDALLGEQLGVLEVVAQHRLDQGRRVSPQAEQTEVGQQTFPVQPLALRISSPPSPTRENNWAENASLAPLWKLTR